MYKPVAEIHLDRLIRNYRKIQNYVEDALVLPVIKANAYGHGLIRIAKALQGEGVTFFSVFTLGSAIKLRENGISGNILIFSRFTKDLLQLAVEFDITLSIACKDDIQLLIDFFQKTERCPKLHLKVDTGMSRLGIDYDEVQTVLEQLKVHPEIHLEGIYSHFATADEGDPSYAELQLSRFSKVVKLSKQLEFEIKYYHIANSGAVLNLPESFFNLVRVGMLMYGAYPSDETSECIAVEPVMSFKAPIVLVRGVKAGVPVSYGSVYTPDSDSYIGVVQAGFVDGVPRNWFERGYVGYRGKNYNIAGRICMDQFMVNFGNEKPQIGDDVLIFGNDGTNQIPIEDIASDINLTPYVLMSAIGGRTERVYINDGECLPCEM